MTEPFRLAADCPLCRAPLALRKNRRTLELFVSCTAYPGCRFAEAHDPRVQFLAKHLTRLTIQSAAPTQRDTGQDLNRELRQLIAFTHPDRWPNNPLSHEITTALVALRERLNKGV